MAFRAPSANLRSRHPRRSINEMAAGDSNTRSHLGFESGFWGLPRSVVFKGDEAYEEGFTAGEVARKEALGK